MKYNWAVPLLVALLLYLLLRNRFPSGTVSGGSVSVKVDVPVITSDAAKVKANDLYNAMRNLGTDEKVLREVLEYCETRPGALRQIYNAFGSKRYFWGEQSAFLGQEQDLKQWIRDEISGDLLVKWNQLFEKEDM